MDNTTRCRVVSRRGRRCRARAAWPGTRERGVVTCPPILDRLLHHSTTLHIRGESYRLKDR